MGGAVLWIDDSPASPDSLAIDGWDITANRPMRLGLRSLSTYNLPALQQSSWYVDAVNGDDGNPGTQLLPIKTIAAWAKQVRDGTLSPPSVLDPNGSGVTAAFCDVYIVNNLPQTDPIAFNVNLGVNVVLRFWGTGQTTTYTGSITGSLTAKAPATNVPWSFQDTGIPSTWTAIGMGQRIRNTNASRQNVISWTAKDLGTQTVRTSDWGVRTILPVEIVANSASVTPVVNDTYVIEQLTKAWLGDIYVSGIGNNTTRSIVGFMDLDFQLPSGSFGGPSLFSDKILQWFMFSGCKFTNATSLGTLGLYLAGFYFENCGFAGPGGSIYLIGGNIVFEQGCNIGKFITPLVACQITYDGDFLNQGAAVQLVPGCDTRIGQLAVFDTTSHGLFAEYGCNAKMANFRQGAHRLWGANNSTYGVRMQAGSTLEYVTTAPTLTGNTGDFSLGGVALGWNFNTTTGVWQPAAGLATTWANFAAAQGAAGFGGNATHPGKQCGIYQWV